MSLESTHSTSVDLSKPDGRRFKKWARRVRLERKLIVLLLVITLGVGFGTYLEYERRIETNDPSRDFIWWLVADFALLIVLIGLFARRLVMLWGTRRSGPAGARLHARLVTWFSLVAGIPTILVGVLSTLVLHLGLEQWFDDSVRAIVTDSHIVARSYYEEHQKNIVGDALKTANALRRQGHFSYLNPLPYERVLAFQASNLGLNEAAILNEGRGILIGRLSPESVPFINDTLTQVDFDKARRGDVGIFSDPNDNRVRALTAVQENDGTFLYVSRLIDSRILTHLKKTASAVDSYQTAEQNRSSIKITFATIFAMVGLLVLAAAIWIALIIASRLMRPIGNLMEAAERIGAGDLSVRVPAMKKKDELSVFNDAFNQMTDQIARQQEALIAANRQLDERRRFTELVLSGVSAGVIGLDAMGRITLANRISSQLLEINLQDHMGNEFTQLLPEMAGLLDEARKFPTRAAKAQITLQRNEQIKILLVQIAAEESGDGFDGYVVTFDDITELVSAQRKAAWSDVARRIAHEIKNPLTPIQLSAERLKRKYLKEIQSDPDTFAICTDTIVRQVGDIGRMVDEFSAFARMPAPIMQRESLKQLCEQALFLQRNGHSHIVYQSSFPEQPIILSCDARQVNQAITNLLQNAADAIATRREQEGDFGTGEVRLHLLKEAGHAVIAVEDNGIGLPKADRHRLTEPYVTMRVKGTGLGLAIVKKIMEDHGGQLVFEDRPGGGAIVKLVFADPTEELAGGKK